MEKLSKDSLFLSLFNKANSIQDAIKVAKLYGIHLSIEDTTSYRNELQTAIEGQSFHLDVEKPNYSSWSWWGGGDAAGAFGGYECPNYGGGGGGGGCSDYGGGGD
jgi:hypothetical protein